MSIAELKNDLHRMVVETDNPQILLQIAAFFASLRGEGDWWDSLSEEEKQKIEIGVANAEKGEVIPYTKVREKVKSILGNR